MVEQALRISGIRKSLLSELSKVIEVTEIFDEVRYFDRGFNRIEMTKDGQKYRAGFGLGKSGCSEVLEMLFRSLEKKPYISIIGRDPYWIKFRGIDFSFYRM